MRFLERLLRQTCSHRFTWPRVDPSGQHYQICLDCGTAYQYDWSIMRRTGRLYVLPSTAAAPNAPAKPVGWNLR